MLHDLLPIVCCVLDQLCLIIKLINFIIRMHFVHRKVVLSHWQHWWWQGCGRGVLPLPQHMVASSCTHGDDNSWQSLAWVHPFCVWCQFWDYAFINCIYSMGFMHQLLEVQTDIMWLLLPFPKEKQHDQQVSADRPSHCAWLICLVIKRSNWMYFFL